MLRSQNETNMKPINPYQGPAPAAMSQMGAGLLDVGANIGRTLAAGYESMGKGIAGGINAVADAYTQYKDMTSQVKASEKSYQTLKSYLPEEVQKQFDSQIKSMNQDSNLSLRDKAAFWDQAKSFIGTSVGQTFQMQKQKAELDAAMARQQAGEAAANWRAWEKLQSDENQPFRMQAASMMAPGSFGPSKSAGYGGGKAPGGVSLYDNSPFTFGSHF